MESSTLNMDLTAIHIVFVILIGFWRGDWKNFTQPEDPNKPNGLFLFGVSGVFNGATMVYLIGRTDELKVTPTEETLKIDDDDEFEEFEVNEGMQFELARCQGLR
ncbi:Cationic amino acid transporter 7 protein, partial [Thalictrum thalictroides]